MEAATKNKSRYITAEDIVRQTQKRKGRPCAIPQDKIYYLTAGAMAGDTWRKTVNTYYRDVGLSLVVSEIGKDSASEIFMAGKRILYAGALEQIGRFCKEWEAGKLTAEDMQSLVKIVLDEIEAGEKSKDIERRLRFFRQMYK